jgi:hypothetical protein
MPGLLGLLPLWSLAALPPQLVGIQPLALAPPLTPPPPLAPQGVSRDQRGTRISINGRLQQARWLWQGQGGELWLPLEVLQGQLGVSSRDRGAGTLELEWFGQRLQVAPARQRSLDDEVAVPAGELLRAAGVGIESAGPLLRLSLPVSALERIRLGGQGDSRRVVLDLTGPVLVRSGDGRLLVGVEANGEQLQQLQGLGLEPNQSQGWLQLRGEPRLLTLASPYRLVLDLGPGSSTAKGPEPSAPSALDPRLQALLGSGVQLERGVQRLGSQRLLVHSVRLDPRSTPIDLRPLNRPDGMQGLSSLSQLARQEQALIAINGGYFNRVTRLPLGALRDNGRWLSGPILNRGAMGWSQASLPSFGRLSLEEVVIDPSGQRWPVNTLNSGYLQKGLSRYTADWGRSYQAISGQEMGVLMRHGSVQERYDFGQLNGGVPLQNGDVLLVARGGLVLPWGPGDRLTLSSRVNDSVGQQPFVVGGGPLLLQNGRIVLNGTAEGFSSGFLSQGAPRTVVGSDGRQLWLITLQGVDDAGPTLDESARLLQQLGLRDALNLDGGSSTGLVLGNQHTVKGRGVAAAVHNGLGLIPRQLATGSP